MVFRYLRGPISKYHDGVATSYQESVLSERRMSGAAPEDYLRKHPARAEVSALDEGYTRLEASSRFVRGELVQIAKDQHPAVFFRKSRDGRMNGLARLRAGQG